MNPELIIPARVTREFIRAHRELSFVYSTNVFRQSSLGQAAECEGEPNAYGIPVRFRFCKSEMNSYFQDYQMSLLKEQITKAIADIRPYFPVIVLRRIGCGASRMREYAPKTWEWMQEELKKICYPNIKWDYTV